MTVVGDGVDEGRPGELQTAPGPQEVTDVGGLDGLAALGGRLDGALLVSGFAAIVTLSVFVTTPPKPSLTVKVMVSDLVAAPARGFEAASRAAAVGV